jgi:hypothetical protein
VRIWSLKFTVGAPSFGGAEDGAFLP